MARKTATDYNIEYNDLLTKTKALETRIKDRALDLCKKFPNVLVGKITKADEIYKSIIEGRYYNTNTYIKFIRMIEEHNAKQEGNVQTTIYPINN